MAKLMDAVAFLSLNNSKFKRGARDSEKRMHTMGSTFKRVGGMIAGYMGGREILSAVNNWTAMGDAIEEASQRTGVGVEQLSRMKYAADLSGSSIEGLEKNIRFMNKNLQGSPTKSYESGLRRLGLSVAQLKTMNPGEAFNMILQGLSGVSEDAERSAVAMSIFGKTGAEVLPLIAEGYAGYIEQLNAAGAAGAVFTPEQAAAAAAYQDAIHKIEVALTGLIGTLATATPLIDLVTDGLNQVSGFTTEASQALTGTNQPGDVGFMDVMTEAASGVVGDAAGWLDKLSGITPEERVRINADMAPMQARHDPIEIKDREAKARYRNAQAQAGATNITISSANFHATDDMKRNVNRDKAAGPWIQ